jgi:hypothetical protein
MPKSSDDQRIRGGLKFLTAADRAVIRAAGLLVRLTGDPSAQEPDDLLERFGFEVGGNTYAGQMTQDQFTYLKQCTGDPREFADAIARILLKMDGKVVDALKDLNDALVVAERGQAGAAGGGVTPTPTGCCTYDSQTRETTQSFCEGGLQGTWTSDPCVRDSGAT